MFMTTITLDSKTYTYHKGAGTDKVVYHGSNHTDILRDTLEIIRTDPKRSGTNYGVRRLFVRLTRDVESTQADGTTKIEPQVSSISWNIPVGIENFDGAAKEAISDWMVFLSFGGLGYVDWPTSPVGGIHDQLLAAVSDGELL